MFRGGKKHEQSHLLHLEVARKLSESINNSKLRDEFAGIAMGAMVRDVYSRELFVDVAKDAYLMADLMLSERSKESLREKHD